MSERREETTMQNENISPNLTERGKEAINNAAEKGSEWTDQAKEKGKQSIHDTRETVTDAMKPSEKEKSPDKSNLVIDLVEIGRDWAKISTEKGKEVIHDTRETVADAVEPEDTKHAREEASKSMFEIGEDYVNYAAESISGMLSTDKKEGDENDNDKQ